MDFRIVLTFFFLNRQYSSFNYSYKVQKMMYDLRKYVSDK